MKLASALDVNTEKSVMKSIDQIDRENMVVIMVTHRLSSLINFDRIIKLVGKLIKFDSPQSSNDF